MIARWQKIKRLHADDNGQLILLLVMFTVIVALLITVVVNATRVYLTQTSLYAASDAAATAASNALDPSSISAGAARDVLPLSARSVRQRVTQYVESAALITKFHDFAVVDVWTDGRSVRVTFGARVTMPFANVVSDDYRGGYPITSTSSATAPLTD